jgi:hypothetical protein
MATGQTYRTSIEVWQSCDRATRTERSQLGFALRLRAPGPGGTWSWGAWSLAIPLPAAVYAYLAHSATTLTPTLREIVSPDGRRIAVLDLILEVRPGRSRRSEARGGCWASTGGALAHHRLRGGEAPGQRT